jgi:TonB family protein
VFNLTAVLLSVVSLCLGAATAAAGSASLEKTCSALQDIAVPTYPSNAVAAGLHGDVVLVLTVADDGSIAGVVVSSGEPVLADAARSAALRWRFAKGPLANSIPKQVELGFRFALGRGVITLSNEQKRLTVLVPSESTEADLVEAGPLLGFLAAKRSQPPFPGGGERRDQRVVVEVESLADGSVGSVQSREGDPSYRAAAEDAARRWQFRDVRLNGTTVRLRGHLAFNWRLG